MQSFAGGCEAVIFIINTLLSRLFPNKIIAINVRERSEAVTCDINFPKECSEAYSTTSNFQDSWSLNKNKINIILELELGLKMNCQYA